ncbi:MAG: glycosyltransferase family 1 protein [Nitrospirae bacterium]|nr:MAG: glycosyltransferase family 1 protein [Nitrospirota bacterium]
MVKKNKIIIVSNTSWNIYNFRRGLIKAFKKAGYDVLALAPRDRYAYMLEKEGTLYREVVINNKGTNLIEDIRLIIEFYKILKEERPDVVLTYTIKPNIYCSIAASFLNIPIINNISGLGFLFIRDNWLTRIAELLYKFSLRHSKKIFFQNNEDLRFFVEKGIAKEDLVEVIPGSGINTDFFAPGADSKDDGRIIFLLMARMLWDKGIREYVEAAQLVRLRYSNVEFQLLGFMDVPNPEAISRDVVDKWVSNGTVRYLGETDNVKDVINKADVVVLPSYREGAPKSLLEAMSMGKPIITTDTAGCREVCDHEVNGFLVPVKDSQALADAMIRMIEAGEKRKEMGRMGRNKVLREFDERIVVGKYLDVVREVCNV